MKAIRCHSLGEPEALLYEEIAALTTPDPDKVIISVKNAGVNFPDTLIIRGNYQFQPSMPFSPGGEVSGIVKEVGADVDEFHPGDRVIAGTSWGGYAEEVFASASNTHKIPDEIDFVTGAVIAEAYGTSYHSLVDRARLEKGETLMVLGAAGGVGTAAIQIGKLLGAKVIAVASTQEKLKFCKKNGADHLINYSKENLKERAKELTDGQGVDVVYDPVGGRVSEQALRAMAWKGRYLIVGFAAGQIPSIPMNLPLLKGCEIVGVYWGGFFRKQPDQNKKNMMLLIEWVREKKLQPPIEHIFLLEEAALALKQITSRKVMGKIVLSVS